MKKISIELEAKVKKYRDDINAAVQDTTKGQAAIIASLKRKEKAALDMAATSIAASNKVLAELKKEEAIRAKAADDEEERKRKKARQEQDDADKHAAMARKRSKADERAARDSADSERKER